MIKPSWIDYDALEDEVVIELDPGMAFGTGYHPTTKMCLEALEVLVHPGMQLVDLGTGSGDPSHRGRQAGCGVRSRP